MLGDIQWLQWKSKKERARDEKEYNEWAFPYGEAQAEKVKAILHELFPKESEGVNLVCFLTVKEMFSDSVCEAYYSPALHDKAVNIIRKDLKRYKKLFTKGTDTTYYALGMADNQIGPELDYPSIDELRATAKHLDEEIQRVYDELKALGKEK
jgi:hypothetical protein